MITAWLVHPWARCVYILRAAAHNRPILFRRSTGSWGDIEFFMIAIGRLCRRWLASSSGFEI